MSLINKDIDTILLRFLEIDDLRNLYQTNKYYYNKIKPLLQSFIDFHLQKNMIKLPIWIKNYAILFNKTIIFGKLDVCKYYNKYYNFDIKTITDSFHLTCMNGHLEIAKWLINTFPNIDIHAEDEYAFRYSCYNGNLLIAKWLIEIFPNIDIHAYNEFAFRYSCIYNHLEVAKWLINLDPSYSCKIINKKNIPYKNMVRLRLI